MRQVERLSDTVNLAEGQRQQIRHGGALSGGTQKVTLGVTDQVIRTTLGWQPSCTCNAATAPGIVLDPFAGSGTTGRVAKRLGRRAILIEQNEAYCELAAESLTQQVFDFA
jgi:16S rRNA G966 N2-methylase RsmD